MWTGGFRQVMLLVTLDGGLAGRLMASGASPPDFYDATAEDCTLSLLQTGVSKWTRDNLTTNGLFNGEKLSNGEKLNTDGNSIQRVRGEPVCRELTNYATYFTLPVQVGTPPRTFDLIPDTGSSDVLVPDCNCVKSGRCGSQSVTCFNTRKSSSFRETDMAKKAAEEGEPMEKVAGIAANGGLVIKTYGSGPIECSMGTDKVAIGGIEAVMEDSLYLMQSRMELNVGDNFEGLLGMGVPYSVQGSPRPMFMEEAGVSRWSLCFNDGGEPGILRMNIPKLANPLGNMGTHHWGLDMQGMSVGDAFAPVLFCDPSSKGPGMKTTCGAVPDSGTTMIMGPQDQIITLFQAICDNWSRCTTALKATPGLPKEHMFTSLLAECGEWLEQDRQLDDEIPPITLHLAGASGEQHSVKLSAWAYIGETSATKFQVIHKQIFGRELQVVFPVGETKTCSPSFQAQDMMSEENGPLWILGSALFYDKTVSYDISTNPPAISIDDSPCTSCSASLHDTNRTSMARSMRSLDGPLREPSFDVTRAFDKHRLP